MTSMKSVVPSEKILNGIWGKKLIIFFILKMAMIVGWPQQTSKHPYLYFLIRKQKLYENNQRDPYGNEFCGEWNRQAQIGWPQMQGGLDDDYNNYFERDHHPFGSGSSDHCTFPAKQHPLLVVDLYGLDWHIFMQQINLSTMLKLWNKTGL